MRTFQCQWAQDNNPSVGIDASNAEQIHTIRPGLHAADQGTEMMSFPHVTEFAVREDTDGAWWWTAPIGTKTHQHAALEWAAEHRPSGSVFVKVMMDTCARTIERFEVHHSYMAMPAPDESDRLTSRKPDPDMTRRPPAPSTKLPRPD